MIKHRMRMKRKRWLKIEYAMNKWFDSEEFLDKFLKGITGQGFLTQEETEKMLGWDLTNEIIGKEAR